MADPTPAPLLLRMTATDPAERAQLESLARDLQTELDRLGVLQVQRVPAERQPDGTRSGALAVAAFALGALGTTADLIAVLQVLRQWWSRDRRRRALTLTIAGTEIGTSDADNVEVLRAIAAARARSSGGVRGALIIANSVFSDRALSRLRSPAHDADALADVLGDPAIGGFDVRMCLDETEHGIRRGIADFFADRDPDDLLLVHYSGHGLKDTRGRLYLASRDTDLRRLSATAVAAGFLSDQITESPPRHVILILDCCYGGAFARGAQARADSTVHVGDEFSGHGRVVLTASSATEYAFDGDHLDDVPGTPSVFTSALVRGLRTGAADLDADGDITIDELYDYTYREVRRAQPDQTPAKWTFGVEGSLVLARSVRGAELPRAVLDDLASGRIGLRLEAVEELHALLGSGRPGMREAARHALNDLRDRDDSIRVRDAASNALAMTRDGWSAPVPAAEPVARSSATPATAVRRPEPSPSRATRSRRSPRGRLIVRVLAGLVAVALVAVAGIVWFLPEDTIPCYDTLSSVAFSPDGATIATGGWDEKTRLWDVATGRNTATLSGPGSQVESVAFSPDGKTLAAGGWDDTVELWDVAAERHITTFRGAGDVIRTVAFSPDGKMLAAGGWDSDARLWDVATGRTIAILSGHADDVNAVAFSPDGNTLATASDDSTARLWDVATKQSTVTLTGHSYAVMSVAFSPDGKTLATGGADSTTRLWTAATGKSTATLAADHDGAGDYDGSIGSMDFSPDGKTLVTGSVYGIMRRWEVATGRSLAVLTGHRLDVESVTFSPDGKTLATAGDDGTARLWDVATGRSTFTTPCITPWWHRLPGD